MTDTGRDGEIVVLKSGTSGRSCEAHLCCGASLHVGDLVRFHLVMLEVQGGAPTGSHTESGNSSLGDITSIPCETESRVVISSKLVHGNKIAKPLK
jgi:hypothetical protein